MAESKLEQELVDYVTFKRSLNEPDFTFEDALKGHRRVCIEALVDSGGEQLWIDRAKELDRLAASKGYAMYDEPTVSNAIATVAERERKRREEFVRENRARALAEGIGTDPAA